MSSYSKIRVMIVDDHFMVRVGLGAIINSQPDMTVMAEGRNGFEAVELYEKHQPDVTLLDLRLPGLDGVKVIGEIIKKFPQARIIVISTYGGDEDIFRAMRAGARTYFMKHVDGQELVNAIRAVHAGECPLPPDVASLLIARMRRTELSPREMEVFELLVRGMSNKEIANQLNISEGTVRVHVSHVLPKLGCTDRAQAIAEAFRRGIVHVTDPPKK
ncbi:MAG: response regulator [Acidobacteriota bacterium]